MPKLPSIPLHTFQGTKPAPLSLSLSLSTGQRYIYLVLVCCFQLFYDERNCSSKQRYHVISKVKP